ncbi:MAG TPA: hypothetical protein VHO48_10760, partial [Anaerolineaceae bacterium]|nr:hypothetical protein [Anaerolineaceae bacterium]
SVIVVMADRIIPGGMGLASGLILGFNCSSGALGMLFGGILADRAGFPPVFISAAVAAFAGGILAFTLKAEPRLKTTKAPLGIEGD